MNYTSLGWPVMRRSLLPAVLTWCTVWITVQHVQHHMDMQSEQQSPFRV